MVDSTASRDDRQQRGNQGIWRDSTATVGLFFVMDPLLPLGWARFLLTGGLPAAGLWGNPHRQRPCPGNGCPVL